MTRAHGSRRPSAIHAPHTIHRFNTLNHPYSKGIEMTSFSSLLSCLGLACLVACDAPLNPDASGDTSPGGPVSIATISVSRQIVGVRTTEPLVITATVILAADADLTMAILGEALYEGAAVARFTRLDAPDGGLETSRSRAFEAQIPPALLHSPDLRSVSGEVVTAALTARFVTSTGAVIEGEVSVRIVCGATNVQDRSYWFCDGGCGDGCGGCGRTCEISPTSTWGRAVCSESDAIGYACQAGVAASGGSEPTSESCNSICARHHGASGKPGRCVERCWNDDAQFRVGAYEDGHGLGVDFAWRDRVRLHMDSCDARPDEVWQELRSQFEEYDHYRFDEVKCCCELPF